VGNTRIIGAPTRAMYLHAAPHAIIPGQIVHQLSTASSHPHSSNLSNRNISASALTDTCNSAHSPAQPATAAHHQHRGTAQLSNMSTRAPDAHTYIAPIKRTSSQSPTNLPPRRATHRHLTPNSAPSRGGTPTHDPDTRVGPEASSRARLET